MAEPSDDDDLDELREILREMMDKSPDPYRPDELARIMSDLIERVFPNIGVLKRKHSPRTADSVKHNC